jgi:chromosome segregation ATPase
MNCKEPEMFQMFVTSFLVISEQTDQAKQKTELQLSSQLTEQELKISELTKTNEEQESELQRLRHSHERLIEKYEEERTVGSDNERLRQKVVKLKKELLEVQAQNSRLSVKAKYRRTELQEFREENRVLAERLLAATKLDEERQENSNLLKARIQETGTKGFTLRETEDKLGEAEHRINLNAQQIVRLEKELHEQMESRKRLETEVEKLRNELSQEAETANQLRLDIEQLEKQNEQCREGQRNINHVKRKYAAKKQKMLATIAELDKERRKWETIAKFGRKLRDSKFETTEQVFQVAYDS